MPPFVSAQSDVIWKQMSVEEFQDGRRGGNLGYRKETIIAILNLNYPPMPPIRFRLNPTYGLREIV